MKRLLTALLAAFVFSLIFSGCKVIFDTSAPGVVTDVQVASEDGKIIITWKDPYDKDFIGVKIYNADLISRSAFTLNDGIFIQKGIQYYETSDLEDGKTYSFRISSVDNKFNESSYIKTEPVTFNASAVTGDKIVYKQYISEGTYSVYHFLQKTTGGKTIVDYELDSIDDEKIVEYTSPIDAFENEYEGFVTSCMAQQGSAVYVFYNRKLISYTFTSGESGTFEDGSDSITIKGLYGASTSKPKAPAAEGYQFVKWVDEMNEVLPEIYGSDDKTFTAVWKERAEINDGFVEIEYEAGNYYISPTETLYSQWYEVYQWALENGYSFNAKGNEGNSSNKDVPTEGANKPVGAVSWNDAVLWCNALSEKNNLTPVYELNGNVMKKAGIPVINEDADGYRLPTCEEWVYAAKGGKDYAYSGSDDPAEVSWHKNNASAVQDVQGLAPNDYGLYDMSGNVWEWCWDVDPDDSSKRIMRGGSYFGEATDGLILSYQTRLPSAGAASFGFRLARSKK